MISEGNKGFDIEQYVNGLLWLLYNPNLESRLNSNVTSDVGLFAKNVTLSMMGEVVDGVKYDKVLEKVSEYQENSILFWKLLHLNNGSCNSFPMDLVLKEIGSLDYKYQVVENYKKLSQDSIFYFCSERQ
jgi:hypothetical protein